MNGLKWLTLRTVSDGDGRGVALAAIEDALHKRGHARPVGRVVHQVVVPTAREAHAPLALRRRRRGAVEQLGLEGRHDRVLVAVQHKQRGGGRAQLLAVLEQPRSVQQTPK